MKIEEIEAIFEEIYARTEQRELNWKVAPGNDGVRVNFPRSSVELRPSNVVGGGGVYMHLLNSEGETIVIIRPGIFKEPTHQTSAKLLSMYEAARSKALKVDETLGDLRRNLGL